MIDGNESRVMTFFVSSLAIEMSVSPFGTIQNPPLPRWQAVASFDVKHTAYISSRYESIGMCGRTVGTHRNSNNDSPLLQVRAVNQKHESTSTKTSTK